MTMHLPKFQIVAYLLSIGKIRPDLQIASLQIMFK